MVIQVLQMVFTGLFESSVTTSPAVLLLLALTPAEIIAKGLKNLPRTLNQATRKDKSE
jgi:hypothetical protein